jgi:hypothetical protein
LLPLSSLSLFRNPHLVVIYRDPVAVAVRNAISEHFETHQALLDSINALRAQTRFLEEAKCPALLLSYEKVLAFPETIIQRLLEFCGIDPETVDHSKLLAEIQPNRPEYLAKAARRYTGNIDGMVDGHLCGWCWQVDSMEPVKLELYADDKLLGVFTADFFREDLLAMKMGNGNHGFRINLDNFALTKEAIIRLKVSTRTAEIKNSGKALGAYVTAPAAT